MIRNEMAGKWVNSKSHYKSNKQVHGGFSTEEIDDRNVKDDLKNRIDDFQISDWLKKWVIFKLYPMVTFL